MQDFATTAFNIRYFDTQEDATTQSVQTVTTDVTSTEISTVNKGPSTIALSKGGQNIGVSYPKGPQLNINSPGYG